MTFLIDFGVKGAVALGAAFLLAMALKRASSSIRYAMWTCMLAGVFAMPLVTRVGPRWNIDRGAWLPAPATVDAEQAPTTSVVVLGKRTAPELPWTMIVWLTGAAIMLGRIGAGHWRVRSLFGAAEEIRDPRWLKIARETAKGIGFRRTLTLKRTTATDVPLSYGIIRATVLLPGESGYWTDERRRIVLAHEMIHARRLDSLWGLVAQSALAVNWFNPLAWLAVREFRKEQERSCDDAVVAAGTARTIYAAHLVDLARSIAIIEPALGMAERFDLEGRVHSLLDSGRRRQAASRKMCAAMFVAAVAMVVPLAAVHAQATKASVAGSVYDPSGAIVPGATVSLKNTGAANEEVARADSGGHYKLQNIPAGEYTIRVTARGFAAYQKTVMLEAGTPATADVRLTIGEVKEAVEIAAKRGQASASAANPAQGVRVGGMVQPANLISKVNPAYPADARAEGIEGTVLLRAVISKDGSLLHVIQVSSGVDPRLVSAAMAAVPLWRYQPALLNGEPVEVITTIDLTFRLSD